LKVEKDRLRIYEQEIIQKEGRFDDIRRKVDNVKMKISSQAEVEQSRDKMVEQILGRAITDGDMEDMKSLDMKTLRELNRGDNAKFDKHVKHFAAVTI
jgi:hypothetical protein